MEEKEEGKLKEGNSTKLLKCPLVILFRIYGVKSFLLGNPDPFFPPPPRHQLPSPGLQAGFTPSKN